MFTGPGLLAVVFHNPWLKPVFFQICYEINKAVNSNGNDALRDVKGDSFWSLQYCDRTVLNVFGFKNSQESFK